MPPRPDLPRPHEGGYAEYSRRMDYYAGKLLPTLPPITHRPYDWRRDGC